MSKKLVMGTVVVVVGIFTLVGLFLWNDVRNQVSHTPVSEQQTPPLAPSPQPQTEVLDTSNWQTYRNEEYGFEIRYPSQFILNTEPVRIVGGTNYEIGGSFGDIQGEIVAPSARLKTTNALPALSFMIFSTAEVKGGAYSNLKEYVEFLADFGNSKQRPQDIGSNTTYEYEELSLNGTTAYQVKSCVYSDCFEISVYVQNMQEDVIWFTYLDEVCMRYEGTTCRERVENTIADQILSTFRFVE